MKKTIEITATLRDGVSSKTGKPYHFYVYTYEYNGVEIQLKPCVFQLGALLERAVEETGKEAK